jgi:hypothetical protein
MAQYERDRTVQAGVTDARGEHLFTSGIGLERLLP